MEKLTDREEEQDSCDTKARSISDEAFVENEALFVPHALFDDLIIFDTLYPDRDITLLDAFRNITDVVALIVGFVLYYELPLLDLATPRISPEPKRTEFLRFCRKELPVFDFRCCSGETWRFDHSE